MGVARVRSSAGSANGASVSVSAAVPRPLADGLRVLADRRYASLSSELRLAVAKHLSSEGVLWPGLHAVTASARLRDEA